MAKFLSVAIFVIVIIAGIMFVEARPNCGCGYSTGPPLTLPLPLPAHIPLGKLCQCTPVAIAPTVSPACGHCGSPGALPLNPLLLKALLPALLPALLGQTAC